jgi:GH43 family beta-xylosidase/acetyl esterase/lipase
MNNDFCVHLGVSAVLGWGLCVVSVRSEPQLLPLTGDLGVHDPVVIRENGVYTLFCTGGRREGIIPMLTSTNLLEWSEAGTALEGLPAWATDAIPRARGAWAPDISYFNGKFHLYYSVSTFGRNDSAIGLAVNETLDPTSPRYAWEDRGLVIRSRPGETDWNAIDPNLVIEDEETIWLSWGSFWGGLKMRRIDPATGLASEEDTRLYALAARPRTSEHETPPVEGALEAPTIIRRGDYWYLFASYDFCCRGTNSTYNVRVGRSEAVTGPYVDRDGVPMMEGGGTPVVPARSAWWTGAGHQTVLRDGDQDYLFFHAYDPINGRSQLQISTLEWEDGWPRAAAPPPLADNEYALWTGPAPGALGTGSEDIPTITAYLPEEDVATGAAMVILPGGGYHHLAPHEGEVYARWLAQYGVAGFVVKYRLATHGYHHPAMLQDAARAVRLVRSSTRVWDIDPERVGIMGSSAGGHLASTLLTHFDAGDPDAPDRIDRASSRPDLGILCYPVISMGEFTHTGSRDGLLGRDPPPELLRDLSNELQVTSETPPVFLWHTWEDTAVPVENSLQFAAALREHGVPFDLHVYQKGGHGLGLGTREPDFANLHPWAADCLQWLKVQGFIAAMHPSAAAVDPGPFHNPILEQRADPWVYLHTDGFYYFIATVPEWDRLEMRRADSINGLRTAEPVVIWRAHEEGDMAQKIWAPELHRIDDAWYIHVAAAPHTDTWGVRMYVLENRSPNPMEGEWTEKGRIHTGWDSFSLDATTFEHRGTRYLVWAQMKESREGNSDLYIAAMENPWTIRGPQVLLSTPEQPWETRSLLVNEGPAVLGRNGRIFITYSANATDHTYCLGLLTADEDSNLLDPASWTKSGPVMESNPEHRQFGPGHNSFTQTKDGQDVIVYHARPARVFRDPLGEPNRHTRAQLFTWNPDGTPDFGAPLPNHPNP